MTKADSIIEIIQKMVQEGQSSDKIVATLHDLGVSDDQAKRLLLIAEADTFTLLKKEINNLVREEVYSQKKDFEDMIKQDLKQIEAEEKLKTSEIAHEELKEVKNDVLEQSRGFEGRVNKVINDSQKTVSLVRVALDSLNNRLSQIELDVEQMKVHKFRKKSMFFSYTMLSLGAMILLIALFLLFMNFAKLDVSQIVIISILILASVTLMFASIIG
ncbi:MAG: hypothetical protein WC821_04155 [archaeon]|jgi:hypothetical protein